MTKQEKSKEIKLTTEELKRVTDVQQSAQSVFLQLGQLQVEKNTLKDDFESKQQQLKKVEEDLLNRYRTIVSEEKTIIDQLEGKYGSGNLNTKTGEFTPI
jgi:hypothetical protein